MEKSITDFGHSAPYSPAFSHARKDLLKSDPKAEPLIKASKEFLIKVENLEARMHNPKAEVTYDILAQPGGAKLYSKYVPLFGWIHDSDGPVTQGMQAIVEENSRELRMLEKEFNSLLAGGLAQFNQLAKKLEIPDILPPEPTAASKAQAEKARAPRR